MELGSVDAGPGDRHTRADPERPCGVSHVGDGEHHTRSGEGAACGDPQVVGWPDRPIAQIASGQRALITRRQLSGLGVTRGAVEHALSRGRVHRMHRGVYALVPSPALPPLARELAAVLACGDGTLLSHHSAAAVWGIRPFLDGDVDVTVVGRDPGTRRAGIRVHRTAQLDPRDTRRHQQIPITSPARALLDIAPEVSGRSLEWALDQALVKRLTTRAQIKAVLAAYPHRPGAPRLSALLDSDRPTSLTSSTPEERLFRQMRKGNLPIPEVNARVGNYTADFLWRAHKVILEIDGYQYHHTRAAFERDHRRDAEHQREDFLVIRVTPRQLQHNHEAILVHVATTLERRRPA
ncbi:MAG TPA: type IV toxin-antitoxin system AbiEi family antitoxin domain-containing protein [Solirubrobacteraceae bacterium]|nr:type IV toxin-antitoxin system AbiEi family antitoxin domain-containing protein [Solirubrobacteraceae bacterium]